MPSPNLRRLPTPAHTPGPADDWRHRAECRDADDPDRFFPLPGQSPRPALAFCDQCPVRAICLEEAIARGEGGVRGGMTESARDQYARSRRRKASA